MGRFDIRVQARRSGKTSKLQQLITDEVAKGDSKVIAMAVTHTCLKNLTRGINKETKLSNNYSELIFRSDGLKRLRGLGKVEIFFDEIYLLEIYELEQLRMEVALNSNIELISYTSHMQ